MRAVACYLSVLLLAGGQSAPASAATQEPAAPAFDAGRALDASQAVIGSSVPDHTLLDRDGRALRLSSYRGKPLLVSFIYTGCFQVCPLQTRALHEAVKGLDRLLGPQQFNVISIGFNQPADSPQAMRAFAAQYRIDEPNWEFLSPPLAAVDALTRDFGFSYLATPAGFDHLLGVTVVDADGRVYAQVYGERMTPDQLGEPLRLLLRGAPMPPRPALSDLIDRVRLVCTVYDPDTGTYRYNYGLIIEIAGGVTFLLAVLVYFGLEARTRWRARRGAGRSSLPVARASH